MGIAVVMPQLGLTMEEGTVSAWLKKTGDPVKKDDLLFSVSTDKVEMDVESVADGILGEIIQPAGSTVPVGTVLAYIKGPDADKFAADQSPTASPLEKSAPVREVEDRAQPVQTLRDDKTSGQEDGPRQLISPRAKRLAAKLGVDVSGMRGAAHEQISEQDIRNAAARQDGSSRSKGTRQLIAERLTRSIQTIPAFSVAAEVNAENLIALHENLKASRDKASGAKLTITDLLLSAFAAALKSCPEMNAVWEENEILYRTSVNLGLAVATAKGVVAPVIRNVEALDIQDVAVRRSELVEKARAARLALTDMEGGVGTLSNLGMYRVDHFQAIINPGQSSILAVGQIRQRPWVDTTLTVKRTVMLNLTVDHRLADGAAAAVFLGKMVELIENPEGFRVMPGSSPRNGAGGRLNG